MPIVAEYEFETQTMTLDREWPESITAEWKAKPVGRAYFTPANDAERREKLSHDLLLYTIRGDVFVVCRFDPITERFIGAKVTSSDDAEKLRISCEATPLNGDELLVLKCLSQNARTYLLNKTIEGKTCISGRTVSKVLDSLISKKLAVKQGERSGATITEEGKRRLAAQNAP